jgi:hypothetical protein
MQYWSWKWGFGVAIATKNEIYTSQRFATMEFFNMLWCRRLSALGCVLLTLKIKTRGFCASFGTRLGWNITSADLVILTTQIKLGGDCCSWTQICNMSWTHQIWVVMNVQICSLNVWKTWKRFQHFCPNFFVHVKKQLCFGHSSYLDSFQELSNGNALDNVRVSPLYFLTLLYHLGNMCVGHVMPWINSSSFILSCPALWLQGQGNGHDMNPLL